MFLMNYHGSWILQSCVAPDYLTYIALLEGESFRLEHPPCIKSTCKMILDQSQSHRASKISGSETIRLEHPVLYSKGWFWMKLILLAAGLVAGGW